MVHISAIGASDESSAQYARSKAEGEAAVRAAFPTATIMRPSVVFGPEDDFFNTFGWLATFSPVLPVIGSGDTRFQPVYVGDVAAAIVNALGDDATAGQTYELGGPRVYTFREIMELVLSVTGRRRLIVPLPFALAKIEAMFLQLLPRPLLTMDQVELLKSDNVLSGDLPGLDALGVTPVAAEGVLPSYLARYRKGGKMPTAQTA
jgi:NADH dehydrogenase